MKVAGGSSRLLVAPLAFALLGLSACAHHPVAASYSEFAIAPSHAEHSDRWLAYSLKHPTEAPAGYKLTHEWDVSIELPFGWERAANEAKRDLVRWRPVSVAGDDSFGGVTLQRAPKLLAIPAAIADVQTALGERGGHYQKVVHSDVDALFEGFVHSENSQTPVSCARLLVANGATYSLVCELPANLSPGDAQAEYPLCKRIAESLMPAATP